MSSLEDLKHLEIPLKVIEAATKNFKTIIGKGGYGMVYKGEFLNFGRATTVAVKRLNEQQGQGLKEFLTEIQLLSGQQHRNVISLLGYCEEGEEKMIVYEYATRGSLDTYLTRSRTRNHDCLTWQRRLEICIDAAQGLNHLHNHVRKGQIIIHRDIKSSNILIDDNWVAKISDLGLSKLSLKRLEGNKIVTNACGTIGYCDPEYTKTGILTKESDIYSFGMVLFEVLCGRLCHVKDKHDGIMLSASCVKEYYQMKKLEEIIDPSLREEIGSDSLSRFAEIAYRCLLNDRRQRPSIDVVVKALEDSLRIHLSNGKDVGSPSSQSSEMERVIQIRKIEDIDSEDEAKDLFRKIDKDQNGFISFAELRDYLKDIGEKRTPKEIDEMIREWDLDGDRQISYEEFKIAMNKKMEDTDSQDEDKKEFRTIDKDQNGFISFAELRDFFNDNGKKYTDNDIDVMIREWDLDGDRQISYEEFKIMVNKKTEDTEDEDKNLFRKIDKDQNGFLSFAELRNFYKNIGMKQTDKEIDAIIHALDLDGDRQISFEEFKIAVNEKTEDQDPEDEDKALFQKIDKDQNGFISFAELRDLMQDTGHKGTDKEIETIMRAWDLDGDRQISYEEFKIASNRLLRSNKDGKPETSTRKRDRFVKWAWEKWDAL